MGWIARGDGIGSMVSFLLSRERKGNKYRDGEPAYFFSYILRVRYRSIFM